MQGTSVTVRFGLQNNRTITGGLVDVVQATALTDTQGMVVYGADTL